MVLKLLNHDWKSLKRSTFFTKSIIASIGLGFLALYFILIALGIGIGADFLIRDTFPEKDAVQVFSTFFVIYLFGDVIFRFIIQKYPSIAIEKYLTLNISRRFLSHYISIKSIFSFFRVKPKSISCSFISDYLKIF